MQRHVQGFPCPVRHISNHHHGVEESPIRRSSEDRQAVNLANLYSALTKFFNPNIEAVRHCLVSLSTTNPESLKILRSLPSVDSKIRPPGTASQNQINILDHVYKTAREEERNDLLRKLGESQEFEESEEKALLALGGDFITFLNTLDSVFQTHQSVETSSYLYAEISLDRKEMGWTLVTERPACGYFLLGSLTNVGKRLYGTDLQLRLETSQPNIFQYKIEKGPAEEDTIENGPSCLPQDLPIGVKTFCETFPWHLIIDENMEIVQLGTGFTRLIGSKLDRLGSRLDIYFEIVRPQGISFTFNTLIRRTNSHFVIKQKDTNDQGLEIKGEMVFCEESNTLLYIGSPCADGLDSLNSKGLFISDIPLHDATRDVILVGEQARAQDGLRKRMDKLKNSIEEASDAVLRERERNVQLLHMIFPPDIAERLWLGQTIEAKTYQSVTMLFSDIVGFTSICSTATPFMVCSMLERIYKQFDYYCSQFDVYKVETIGDAYCVAAGIQKPDDLNHAQRIAWMALSMIDICPTYNDHEGKKIQMRIGIHTGTVLAGIVGVKMPRYCLFGHNVTLTNKFESGSEPLRINVSPSTYEQLKNCEGFSFEARERRFLPKEFPPNIPGTCYFLLGYKHPGVEQSAPINEHIFRGAQSIGLCKDMKDLKVDYNAIYLEDI